MRIFIAIDLDNEIKKNLSLLILKLNKGNRNIKWVKNQGMHMTLKFLGEIKKEKVSEIESALLEVTKEYKSFPLRFKGTGTFPPGKKVPRVLWIGIERCEILKSLQSRLEEELEKLDFPKENREFHPHLTLGRVKTSFVLGPTLSEFEIHNNTDFGEMEVNKITLFMSTLKPTGAEYTVISEFELK